ncbi:MAG: hypothetical protein ACHQVK_04270, partial [Candidatus Paceibacterales bacterium]
TQSLMGDLALMRTTRTRAESMTTNLQQSLAAKCNNSLEKYVARAAKFLFGDQSDHQQVISKDLKLQAAQALHRGNNFGRPVKKKP